MIIGFQFKNGIKKNISINYTKHIENKKSQIFVGEMFQHNENMKKKSLLRIFFIR